MKTIHPICDLHFLKSYGTVMMKNWLPISSLSNGTEKKEGEIIVVQQMIVFCNDNDCLKWLLEIFTCTTK